MKKNIKDIGSIIKEYRVKSGLTQMELALQLGYKIPQFISLIENGHSKLPLNVASQLIGHLNIPEKVILEALVFAYETEARNVLKKNKKVSNR